MIKTIIVGKKAIIIPNTNLLLLCLVSQVLRVQEVLLGLIGYTITDKFPVTYASRRYYLWRCLILCLDSFWYLWY